MVPPAEASLTFLELPHSLTVVVVVVVVVGAAFPLLHRLFHLTRTAELQTAGRGQRARQPPQQQWVSFHCDDPLAPTGISSVGAVVAAGFAVHVWRGVGIRVAQGSCWKMNLSMKDRSVCRRHGPVRPDYCLNYSQGCYGPVRPGRGGLW